MALADWSSTASSNATTLGVNIGEGCPPGNVNDAIRKVMADVAAGINVSLLGTFLSSTTLGQARTALGVTEGSASQTAFGALTNTANKVPYMTGSDGWATTTLTSFARTLLDDGDAATARATLGITTGGTVDTAIGGSSSSGSLGIGPLTLTWKNVTVSSGSSSQAYGNGHTYSSWGKAWVEGDDSNDDVSVFVTSHGTSSATIRNNSGSSASIILFSIGV